MTTPDLQGVRLLLVDDTPDNLDMLALLLRMRGATVFTAASVPDAFELLERESVDVLVTDLGMPDQDGYDLLRCVRREQPDGNGYIPAVAVTGFASESDRERTRAAGFRAHFAKPIDVDELSATLTSLADRA